MTPDQLAATAAYMFGVPRAAIFGRSRLAKVAEARMALAWALRQDQWSLESIGDYLHRDHTTIIYAVRTIEHKRQRSPRLAEKLTALTAETVMPQAALQIRLEALEIEVARLAAQLKRKAA